MSSNHARRWRIALTGVWVACVVIGSFLPDNWKSVLLTKGPLHLPIHFAVFALSGFLVPGKVSSLRKRAMLYTVLIGLALGLELLQFAFFTIDFEWRDFAADTAGILAGPAVHLIGFIRRANRLRRQGH